MADIYSSFANGDDGTGTGTAGNPFKTRQKGVDNSGGGDTLRISDITVETGASATIWTSGFSGGTSTDQPFVTRGWDEVSGPFVDGRTELDGNNAIANIFSPTSFPANVIFIDIHMHNTTGIVLDAPTDCHVINCEFANGGSSSTVNLGNRATVVGCDFNNHTTSATALVVGATSKVFLNRFTGTIIGAALSASSNDVIIVANLFHDLGDNGIVILTAKRSFIMNNTIEGDGTNGVVGIVGNGTSEVMVMINNIIEGFSGTSSEAIDFGGGNALLFGNNLFFDNTADILSKLVRGLDTTVNDVFADPEFADVAGNDYEPGLNAKAVGFTGAVFPGTATRSFRDIGAVQRQEPPVQRGSMSGGLG